MAGIGFELRRILARDNYAALLQAYGYAGVISSGPWVLSILGVMLVGYFSLEGVPEAIQVGQFLVSVTHLMAASLILTGALQLLFTRFVADREFEGETQVIFPNLCGALTLVTSIALGLSLILGVTLFADTGLLYRMLMSATLTALCNIWMVVIFLAGMKRYRAIVWAFFCAYSTTFIVGLALRPYGVEGLLFGFLVGQIILLFMLLALVARDLPGVSLVSYRFLSRRQSFWVLMPVGLLFNLGVWVDKYLFWLHPATSQPVIGPLRASLIYDLPIFLAYLSIIPGMAIFLIRIETDFAESYARFYDSVRNGDALDHITRHKNDMIAAVRGGLYDIIKVQGVTVVLLLVFAEQILQMIGLSLLYLPLLRVDLVGVGVQVLLLAVLNVLFYLDLRRQALYVCFVFFSANGVLTYITQLLGPDFYGYGFLAGGLLASALGYMILERRLGRLEYETFMLQR
jgi:uncharacterized membrane protein